MNARQARLQRLTDVLQNGSMFRLKDAAALVNVSEMTVRRDIASKGSGLACLGGFVISAPRYALEVEQAANIQVKREVGRRAAELVKPGDTVFLDCGTTIPYVAEALPPGELTVVCYSLNIASIVCRRANTQVLLLGGLYYPSSATFFSEEAITQLERIAITSAFISAGGVDFSRGVSCPHFHEVPVKQAAMASARYKYLVVDSSKFGRLRPATIARVDAFDSVITDDGLNPAERARLPPLKPKARSISGKR
jgi:DeoR family transcriptional regulator, deoxyribose operon repressor